MAVQTLTTPASSPAAFPAAKVRRLLRPELEKIADETSILQPKRPEWEPLLDSKRVVGVVLVIEDLFPGIKIRPDKVVRKGGYNSVDEALDDMVPRIEREVT